MALFAKAANGDWLPPGARMLLKVIEGFLVSAFVTAVVAVTPSFTGDALIAPDWRQVAHTFLLTFVATFILALKKYFSAHLDGPPSDTVSPAPAAPPPSDAPSAGV